MLNEATIQRTMKDIEGDATLRNHSLMLLVAALKEARQVAADMRGQLLAQQAMPDDPGRFPWELDPIAEALSKARGLRRRSLVIHASRWDDDQLTKAGVKRISRIEFYNMAKELLTEVNLIPITTDDERHDIDKAVDILEHLIEELMQLPDQHVPKHAKP